MYEEAASKPSLSKTSFDMGTAVTIYTNRQSSIATHTIRYSFFSATGTIATGVTTSCTWTPPVLLAAQIPNATSSWGTILCDTYVNGSLVSTNTCTFQLTVPASVVPSISNVAFSEATSGIADRFGGYVRTRSKLSVSITVTGAQGSSISAYRTSIDSVTYSGSSFTTNALNTAGNLTMTVTVTDSRGRTAARPAPSPCWIICRLRYPSLPPSAATRTEPPRRRMVRRYAFRPRQSGVTLSQRGEDLWITGSDVLVYRAIFNLVENSVKYNRPGGSVCAAVSHQGEEAMIEIKDTGCGIPEDFRESVFQPFFRVDKSRSREKGGVGLGLSLVWEIVHLHSGDVRVRESGETGTVIEMTLPISAEEREMP